jgi:hypothetical protein
VDLALTSRRAGIVALAVGLGLALLVHGSPPVAVFDGLPLPEAPYRYVNPPPDQASSNQPPEPGQETLPVQNGQVPGGGVQTGDGQVLVFFGLGALRASSSATSVTIRIDPLTDPPAPPSGSQIRGNVYRISGTEQPGGASVTVVHGYNVTMRYPPGPFKELQFYDGGSWHALRTSTVSGNPYAGAVPTALGEIAATAPAGASGESLFTALARIVESYGLLLFILLFGAIAIWQEIRRRRRTRDSARMGGGRAR